MLQVFVKVVATPKSSNYSLLINLSACDDGLFFDSIKMQSNMERNKNVEIYWGKYIEVHFGNITMFPSDKNTFKNKKKEIDLINIGEQCLEK